MNYEKTKYSRKAMIKRQAFLDKKLEEFKKLTVEEMNQYYFTHKMSSTERTALALAMEYVRSKQQEKPQKELDEE